MAKLFYVDYSKGEIFKFAAVYEDSRLANALTAHAFKDPAMMHRIHQFYLEMEVKTNDLQTIKHRNELVNEMRITGRAKAFP